MTFSNVIPFSIRFTHLENVKLRRIAKISSLVLLQRCFLLEKSRHLTAFAQAMLEITANFQNLSSSTGRSFPRVF